MSNSERAAYLRGLMEGLALDPEAKETKVLSAMLDLLDDLSSDVEVLEGRVELLQEEVDELDEDLGSVEEEIYAPRPRRNRPPREEDWDEEAEFEVNCPSCGKSIRLTDEMLDGGEIVCPGCGENLRFEFDEEDEEPLGCEGCPLVGDENEEDE